MIYNNTIELEISGDNAMFTDPDKIDCGGPVSLPVPTFEAVRGILCSVYWKPTFVWIPDELRVMNLIKTEKFPVKLRHHGKIILTEKERLVKVRYQIRAHFVWNENRPELACDRDENKHFRIALRSLAKGGRRNVYLGTADCCGYVRPAHFGSGDGFYGRSNIDFGEMYHGKTYPDENRSDTGGELLIRRWNCVMQNGIIRFAPPEECRIEPARTNILNQEKSEDYAGAGSPN